MQTYELANILRETEVDVKTFLCEEVWQDEEENLLKEKNLTITWFTDSYGMDGYLQYVVKVTYNDENRCEEQFFALDAYSDSWSGTMIDDPYDFYEVKPVQKIITVYERV